jgi:hypothetical protein
MQPQSDWHLAFEGDVWHVKILQTELDGRGIETRVPDDYVPSQDPHLSGTATSASQLYVHSADLERARSIVAEHGQAKR